MVLKLYGFPISTCTRRVALTCKELNIPYELIPVDPAKGENKTPEWLEKQPFGQVPVLDDDGFEVYESRAICRYIAAKADSSLLPRSDPRTLAKFETAASIEINNFDIAGTKLFVEKLVKPGRTGNPPDENVIRELLETLDGKLAAYDKILSKQKYLAGDEYTLADLFHIPVAFTIETYAGFDIFTKHPNVARWWKDISSREAWKALTSA